MNFKNAVPEPSVGEDYSKIVSLVRPDQSLSLQEILDRFTRGESLPVEFQAEFGADDPDNPLNVDLEKLQHADLVEKAEYIEKLKAISENYRKQEASKAKKKADEDRQAAIKADEERILRAAEKLAKEKSGS